MSEPNKLKTQMNKEIKRVINKYNAAVFILNGGSVSKAIELYGFKCPSKTLRAMCKASNPEAYREIMEVEDNIPKWCDSEWRRKYHNHYNEPKLSQLRDNKHLFIGDSE